MLQDDIVDLLWYFTIHFNCSFPSFIIYFNINHQAHDPFNYQQWLFVKFWNSEWVYTEYFPNQNFDLFSNLTSWNIFKSFIKHDHHQSPVVNIILIVSGQWLVVRSVCQRRFPQDIGYWDTQKHCSVQHNYQTFKLRIDHQIVKAATKLSEKEETNWETQDVRDDFTIGWQNLNLHSHTDATLAPQARQARASNENLNCTTLAP